MQGRVVLVTGAARGIGKEVARQLAGLDVLVNNAAYVDWSETASSADLAAAHQMLEVNLYGPWRLTDALLPLSMPSPAPWLPSWPARPSSWTPCVPA